MYSSFFLMSIFRHTYLSNEKLLAMFLLYLAYQIHFTQASKLFKFLAYKELGLPSGCSYFSSSCKEQIKCEDKVSKILQLEKKSFSAQSPTNPSPYTTVQKECKQNSTKYSEILCKTKYLRNQSNFRNT